MKETKINIVSHGNTNFSNVNNTPFIVNYVNPAYENNQQHELGKLNSIDIKEIPDVNNYLNHPSYFYTNFQFPQYSDILLNPLTKINVNNLNNDNMINLHGNENNSNKNNVSNESEMNETLKQENNDNIFDENNGEKASYCNSNNQNNNITKAQSPSKTSDSNHSSDKDEESVMLKSKTATHMCPVNGCNKIYVYASGLEKHMKLHDKDSPICEYCQRNFPTFGALKLHMRSHASERPAECQLCIRRFSTQDELSHHNAQHLTSFPYKCDECAYRFISQQELLLHARLKHTKDKNTQCPYCSKRYAYESELNKHLPVHTNLHKFECPHCKHKFKYQSSIWSHLKICKKKNELIIYSSLNDHNNIHQPL